MSGVRDGQDLMHIGAVAERAELSLRTLRHYDEIGLVTPSARSEGGFRLYTEADVERILLIRRMKPLGFTLQQMQELLDITDAVTAPDTTNASDSADAPADAVDRLRAFEESAIERRRALEKQVVMADEFLARLRDLTGR